MNYEIIISIFALYLSLYQIGVMKNKIVKNQNGVTIYLTQDKFDHFAEECKWVIETVCKNNSLKDIAKELHVISSFVLSQKTISKMDIGDRVILSNNLSKWFEYERR